MIWWVLGGLAAWVVLGWLGLAWDWFFPEFWGRTGLSATEVITVGYVVIASLLGPLFLGMLLFLAIGSLLDYFDGKVASIVLWRRK